VCVFVRVCVCDSFMHFACMGECMFVITTCIPLNDPAAHTSSFAFPNMTVNEMEGPTSWVSLGDSIFCFFSVVSDIFGLYLLWISQKIRSSWQSCFLTIRFFTSSPIWDNWKLVSICQWVNYFAIKNQYPLRICANYSHRCEKKI